jgi:hypothetical protein
MEAFGMMYRKTALVEAHQFLPPHSIPEGCYQAGGTADASQGIGQWTLDTLEGSHTLRHGDYICIGTAGERWNVERAIFEATYEPSPDASPDSGETPNQADWDAFNALNQTLPLLCARDEKAILQALANHRRDSTSPSPSPAIVKEAGEVEQTRLLEWVLELAKRDVRREQTDFIGRMHQAMGDFQYACDEHPEGDWPEDARDEAGEALAGLAGLALAQLAMVGWSADPLAALSASNAAQVSK